MGSRRFTGKVVSNRMAKTLVVSVASVFQHPKYGKRLIRHRKFHVDTDTPESSPVGSTVTFEECRPMSKTKRWRVIEKLVIGN